MPDETTEIVALIPAAGRSTRLPDLACSKELIPLVRGDVNDYVASASVRVAIEDCMLMLAANGVRKAFVVIAPDKDDIPAYLGDGRHTGVVPTYLVRKSSPSVPHTLAAAIPELGERNAVLVFPDILFRPRNAVSMIADLQHRSGAGITLALVPSARGDKVDIVSTSRNGMVTRIDAKPGHGIGGWTWVAAVWGPEFSDFLAGYILRAGPRTAPEMHVSDVFNAAIRHDINICSLTFPAGEALDIGTPEDLQRLWRQGFWPARPARERANSEV